MDNYICINGKKVELTEEQLKQLGIEVPKGNFFERAKLGETYYWISGCGRVDTVHENDDRFDDMYFLNGNYCTNKSLMEQRALHETLNRLLWRYSMEHDGDKIKWGNRTWFKVSYDHEDNEFVVECNDIYETLGAVFFCTRETAERAIEEIVKPFLAEHPGFKF